MRASAFAFTLLFASVARAQVGEPPTPGVYNPTLGLAGDPDASAADKNPALMGWLRSWSAVYLHSELDGTGRWGGRGDGLFLATPLPYLRAISVGAGIQLLRPPRAFPFGDSQKLTLALGWRLMPALTVGFAYHHFWSSRPPVAGGLDTLDLSLGLRVGRYAAAALVVRDVTAPVVAGLPLQRVWEPEIALRPFGTDLVELGIGARFGERRGDIDPRFRLFVAPIPGLIVKTDLEWRRDVDLDGIPEDDVRVALGLELNLARVGAGAYALFGREAGQARASGFTVSARLSGERYPSLWDGPKVLEKIDLGPSAGGRKLSEILLRMRRIERMRSVAGVVIVMGELGGGWATAEELRAAILRLRHAKKHVYVYQAETSGRAYYVSSAAERVYQDPGGGIRLTGLSQTVLFYKGTGDLLGVKADFVKIAEYKSAPEAYTRTGSTEPARAQREALMQDTYDNLVRGIAASRKVSEARVRAWIDRGPYTAAEAVEAGLADELMPGDEVEGAIAKRLGRPVALREAPRAPERGRTWFTPQIAVIYVDGDITDGKSYTVPVLDLKMVGMRTLIPAITRARTDPRIKAVVVRINSPGGSALASDLIARELERTKAEKPVICSLGDVAASGGYFVAAPCQKIFAAPSTITGSIGIFTGKFDVSGLAEKLGVSLERYERGTHAGMESMWRPYTEEERGLILGKLRYYYERFLSVVAKGRGLAVSEVDEVARGRVWSGRAAQAHGLVDAFGSLADAVAEAKARAGIKEDAPVEVVDAPEEWTLGRFILSLIGLDLKAQAGPTVLDLAPGLAGALRGLPASLLVSPSTPQARLDATYTLE